MVNPASGAIHHFPPRSLLMPFSLTSAISVVHPDWLVGLDSGALYPKAKFPVKKKYSKSYWDGDRLFGRSASVFGCHASHLFRQSWKTHSTFQWTPAPIRRWFHEPSLQALSLTFNLPVAVTVSRAGIPFLIFVRSKDLVCKIAFSNFWQAPSISSTSELPIPVTMPQFYKNHRISVY